MTFSEALEAVNNGSYVTRAVWGGYWFMDIPLLENNGKKCHMQPMIIAKLKTGELVPAQPYQQDLLAKDWQIIEII